MLIRDKIIWLFTGIVICILSLFSVYVYYFYSLYREQNFNQRLINKAKVFGSVLITRNRLNDVLFKNIVSEDLLTIVEEQVVLMNAQRKIIYSNHKRSDTAFFASLAGRLANNKGLRFSQEKYEGAGLIYEGPGGKNYYIFVAGYDSLGESKLSILKMILIVGNIIALLVTVVSAYFFSGRLLKPIKKIVTDVNAISEKNLDATIDEGNRRDEFAMLSVTFNRMLLRLRNAFEVQKSFIAHSSHQLRTPLANLLGTMQTSIDYDKTLPEMKASMESGVEELKHLIELTNNLLDMTRAEDTTLSFKEDDLDLILLQAREQALKKYSGRTVTTHVEQTEDHDSSYEISCNRSLMTTAVFNLIDNALKYSENDVQVQLFRDNGNLVIKIRDEGKGIPEQEIGQVFNPLFRGSNTRNIPGFGIGLALTQKVIRLHKGTVSINNNRSGTGTIAEVKIPA